MEITGIGQAPPVTETHGAGHGGAHAKTQHPASEGARGDTVQISHAARMAAQRAAQEEADAKARSSKDAPKRRQPGQQPPPPPKEGGQRQEP